MIYRYPKPPVTTPAVERMKKKSHEKPAENQNSNESDIIQVGYAGLDATNLVLEKKHPELLQHFSQRFLNNTKEVINKYTVDRERLRSDIEFLQLSNAGIFGGLWTLAESLDTGIKIYLHDILIRQETIEILELFDANPYTYPSKGTFIAAVQDGHKLVRHLKDFGHPAAVIGHTMTTKDRVVVNGDDIRFLTPIDRLYKDEQDSNINTSSLRKELIDEGKDS